MRFSETMKYSSCLNRSDRSAAPSKTEWATVSNNRNDRCLAPVPAIKAQRHDTNIGVFLSHEAHLREPLGPRLPLPSFFLSSPSSHLS